MDLLDGAGLRWNLQRARLRLAEELLHGGSAKAAPDLLRQVCAYAVRQGADPLRRTVEQLAAAHRISLREPPRPVGEHPVPAAFSSLTAREREVLSHLVVGRTYGEIAVALGISKKTVSVHVSHLLAKTQTSTRGEVSALARRVGLFEPEPPPRAPRR